MKKNEPGSKDELAKTFDSQVDTNNIQLVKELISAASSVICVLNQNNQIVFANSNLLDKYQIDVERDILGLRFGDMMDCINQNSPAEECGSGDKCQYCGANYAFRDFWKTRQLITKECRLIRLVEGNQQQYDLEITASPFRFQRDYMVVSMNDVTEKKRREILERIFFHDIINMAGSLSGILELLESVVPEDGEGLLKIASSLSTQIIEEIKGQQQVFKAENGELEVEISDLKMEEFLHNVCDKIKFSQAAHDREIELIDNTADVTFRSDEVLLTRIIFNMAKNALEAVSRFDKITIQADLISDKVRISVHNNTHMEDEVRGQVFQRSYSTKGKNRGLGTYSMKLLGERYLGGYIGFNSSKENGTTFYIEIPFAK